MKPVDSGEGEQRDIDDVDALALDGFTILDDSPDTPVDDETSAPADDVIPDGDIDPVDSDAEPVDADSEPVDSDSDPIDADSDGDDASSGPVDGSGSADDDSGDTDADDDSGDTDTDGDRNNDSTGPVDDADDESTGPDGSADEAAEANTTDGDGDDSGELSFDEWLAAAEIPTPDADQAKEKSGATAGGRGRKKNRRSRRSRNKKSGDKTAPAVAEESSDPNGQDQGQDGNHEADTSMSEIMAELLAAAEQSSTERTDGDEEELDTEVELDQESTSEFTSADGGESGEDKAKDKTEEKANSNFPTALAARKGTTGGGTKSDQDPDEPAGEVTDEEPASDDATEETDTDETTQSAKAEADTEDADTKADAKKAEAEKVESDKTDGETKSAEAKDGKTKEADTDTKVEPDKSKNKDSGDQDSKTEQSKADKPETSAVASVQSPVESKTAGPTVTPLPRPEKSSSIPTALIAVVAAVVGLYAILTVAWAVDTMAHRGEAMRGVQLANVSVGGSDEEALGEVMDTLDANLEARELNVLVDEVDIETDPFSLGVRHDRDPMIDQALEARRGGFIAIRPIRWLFNLFSSEDIPARYTIDAALAASGAEEIISPELSLPVEPEMELDGSVMALVPGAAGVAVDPEEIITLLPDLVDGAAPYELALTAEVAEPQLTDDAVEAVVDEINEQTEQPILAQVLDKQAEVSPRTLKTWMVLDVEDNEADWSIDESLALEDLKPLFPTLGSEDQQARFSVVEGEPIIIPASETVICCEEGTLSGLGAAIKRRIPDPIDPPEGSPEDAEATQPLRRARLEPAITGNDEGVAELEALGIVEEVSTFTTPHDCCANRVINIQRFADLTQGVVIRPGEEFSLNEFVGRRTRENGFVADGAIVLGNFEPQVGGGISQYATTFFNASFFAGIEFLEYQSHSIYISRYPRGREATISWRRPDLKVLNNTDYGILVWNEYTDTSITVTFYSTKNREVEALDLLRSSDRQCRIDITPRVITLEDGTVEEDSVRAIYRPGQGLDCNGNSTTPEEDKPEPANNTDSDTPPAPEPEPEPEPDPEDDGGDDDGEVLPPAG